MELKEKIDKEYLSDNETTLTSIIEKAREDNPNLCRGKFFHRTRDMLDSLIAFEKERTTMKEIKEISAVCDKFNQQVHKS